MSTETRLVVEVGVAPVHEQHLVEVERVAVDLGEDAVGDLVPAAVSRCVVLDEGGAEATSVDDEAGGDGAAVGAGDGGAELVVLDVPGFGGMESDSCVDTVF